jgi:hypothetical protein
MAHMLSPRRRFSTPLDAPVHAALLAALAFATLAASPARAGWLSADSAYSSYRIPEHRWSYWTASLDLAGGHSAAPIFSDLTDRGGSLGGRVATTAAWNHDSDRLQHDWGFSVDASGSRSSRRVEDETLTYESRSSNKDLAQAFSLHGSWRVYPWTTPVGVSLGTSNLLDLGQSFQASHFANQGPNTRTTSDFDVSRGSRRYIGAVSAEVGLGRVRDATPVHLAQVLEDRLRRKGALTRPLSDQARRALAALYAIEPGIEAAHQRPAKYFWRELERILREDGALAPEALDAWDVLRLLEPVSVGFGVARASGFFIGPSVTVLTQRFRDTREESSSGIYYVADTVYATFENGLHETRNDRNDRVFTAITAEIHRPLSPRWQADAFTRVALSEAGESTNLANSVSVVYVISDRWLGLARAFHSANAERQVRRFERWSAEVSGELVYFLEDSWALRLTAYERQNHDASRLFRSGGFQLGLTWIVSGFFEAPGLVPAMHPSPPTP